MLLEANAYGTDFQAPIRMLTHMDDVVEPYPQTPELLSPLECEILPDIDGFNATTFTINNGMPNELRVVVYRQPIEYDSKWGQPDYNHLKASIIEGELTLGLKVEHRTVIWTPEVADLPQRSNIHNLEDLRADSEGFCGLTAVIKDPVTNDYIPYPAVVRFPNRIDTLEQAFGKLPEVKILKYLGKGKNLSPIGKINGKTTLLFRPEGDEYNHKLQVITYEEGIEGAKVINELQFPKSSWTQWRMGTAAGLFWLDDKQAILPIHGINKESSSAYPEGTFDYSLGVALIEKDKSGQLHVVKVAKKPLIVPGQLDHLIGERFPYRRIVYSCGIWLEEDPKKLRNANVPVFNLLVTKGDKGTVLVKKTKTEVIDSLNDDAPTFFLQAA